MINSIFNTLANDASRNAKISILKQNVDNDLLKKVIFLALDPFTQFYIRKIPAYTPNKNALGDNLDWALDQLVTMLASRKVTGNNAIDHLRYVLENVTEDNAKVIERVIQKDLKCGVSESTVNKVWPDLIHEYPCMLASAYDQKLVDKVKFPAYVQLKLDGMRFNAIVRNGVVEFRSRNGKEIKLLGNLDGDFIKMAGDVDCVFDGELLVVDNGRILDRKTGNGILNQANKGTISEAEAKMVRAIVWDVIPFSDFQDGKCPTPYSARFESLCELTREHSPEKVGSVSSWIVSNYDETKELFEMLLSQGQEGIILKTKDMIWENKRSKNQIKFKGELDCDLEVIDWIEGTGKHAGRLGALVLSSSDGCIKVNVGTGFSDADRDSITLGNSIGRIVAIKYNARITEKKAGNHSLFLPVFLEFRTDKTEADHSNNIK
jgi:ATP-dependent DNA ligase